MTLSPLVAASIIMLAALQQASEDHKLASFHDDRAKVTITYPDLLVPKNLPEREAAVAQSNDKIKGSQPDKAVSISSDSIPFLAATPPGAPFAMIQFSRFDAKSINSPNIDAALRDLATGIMMPYAKLLLSPNVGTIVPVDLGNHNGIALLVRDNSSRTTKETCMSLSSVSAILDKMRAYMKYRSTKLRFSDCCITRSNSMASRTAH